MFLGKKGASGDSDTRFADLNVVKDTFKGGWTVAVDISAIEIESRVITLELLIIDETDPLDVLIDVCVPGLDVYVLFFLETEYWEGSISESSSSLMVDCVSSSSSTTSPSSSSQRTYSACPSLSTLSSSSSSSSSKTANDFSSYTFVAWILYGKHSISFGLSWRFRMRGIP